MAKRPKPGGPLEPLKKRAKHLLKRVQSADADALAAAKLHPGYRGGVSPERFTLADALLVVARQEGFPSWPKLKAAAEQSGVIPMEIKFTGIGTRVFVEPQHFAASADFYEQTLSLKRTFRDDANKVATYEFGFGPRLVLEKFDPKEEPDDEYLAARFTGLTLTVRDVQQSYEHLTAQGVPFIAAPEKQYWGAIMAHFKDPGGNTLTLIQMPAGQN